MVEPESPRPEVGEDAAPASPALARQAASTAPAQGRSAGMALPSTPEQVLALQRASGNAAVARLLRKLPLASKVGAAISRATEAGKVAAGRPPPGRVLQRANPADKRLPLDQPEALSHATTAKVEVLSALASLSASPDFARKNIPDLVTARGLKLGPLTPRHDSAVGAPAVKFFTGTTGYADSLTSAETLNYHVSGPARTAVSIRARDHANVDTILPAAQIADRIVQAFAEVSHTMAGPPGAVARFDIYRGKFNGYWDVAPFSTQATEWNPALDSRGPRSTRARNIFQRIFAEDAAFATAYEANTGGIQERVDSYMGPDSMNKLNSPRVQALRARFRPHPAPVTTAAQYNALKADVQAGSAGLQPEDRQAISDSNQWRNLIIDAAGTAVRRDELLAIITNVPAAPPAGPPPPVAPVAPVPVAAGAAQAFLDSVMIDGPLAPIAAAGRTERVRLTPKSPAPNPGVTVDTRFTVTPAARVVGAHVSPASPFPNAAVTGVPFTVTVQNSGNVVMQAQLDLVNEPAGLTAAVPAKLNFTVNDDRRASFIANWRTQLNFTKAGGLPIFDPAMPVPVHYIGGAQTFVMQTRLAGGATNPGLSFFAKVGIHRGGATLADRIDAFPHDQTSSPEFRPNIAAPAVVPVAGDVLDFKYDLLDTDRTTVLKSKAFPVPVLPEAVYTQAQAVAAATADDTWMHGAGPTQLLGLLNAKGGRHAKLAAAIGGPNPIVKLKPITIRHDSAAYVAAAGGSPGQAAWFEGTAYGPHPDPNTELDAPSRPAYALPNKLFLNRTTDVAAGTKRTDAEMVENAIHEGTHAVDEWDVRTPAEDYRSEFRAYWNEGRFGPPDVQIPPPGPNSLPTTIDLTLSPPGPKSPRARKIFQHIYGSYPILRAAYDNDTDGFREMADNYTHPEGLNLNFSPGLDALHHKIRAYTPATFAALHTTVKGFMGIGPAPPTGVLSAAEQTEIQNERSWGLLLNRVVTKAAHRTSLAATLKIP